jgi:hypothetical protein
MACRDTHLDKAAHLLDVFLLDETRGIEMLDLAGDLAVERRRIEGLNARNAIAAFEQRLPCLLRGVANGGQQTDAGDYDSAGNNRSPCNAPALAGIFPADCNRSARALSRFRGEAISSYPRYK